jgi:hypothetical protein
MTMNSTGMGSVTAVRMTSTFTEAGGCKLCGFLAWGFSGGVTEWAKEFGAAIK